MFFFIFFIFCPLEFFEIRTFKWGSHWFLDQNHFFLLFILHLGGPQTTWLFSKPKIDPPYWRVLFNLSLAWHWRTKRSLFILLSHWLEFWYPLFSLAGYSFSPFLIGWIFVILFSHWLDIRYLLFSLAGYFLSAFLLDRIAVLFFILFFFYWQEMWSNVLIGWI